MKKGKASRGQKKEPVTFEEVRRIALSLPGVEEGRSWGSPTFRVEGKLLACMAVHSSSEPNSLVLNNVESNIRDAMVAQDPTVFYFTDHYVNYPVVLIRLSKVSRQTVRALIEASWRRCASKSVLKRSARGKKLFRDGD